MIDWRLKLYKRGEADWVFLDAVGTPFFWASFRCKGDATRALKAYDKQLREAARLRALKLKPHQVKVLQALSGQKCAHTWLPKGAGKR